MDWDLVRFFLAVARSGSLAASAATLGVSQPTVGRKIFELEQQLRCTLFLRSTTGLALTEAGLRLVENATRVRDSIELFTTTAGQVEEAGRIRITASEGIGIFWILPLLRELHQKHPEIRAELTIGNSNADIARGESDIAIRLGDPGDSTLFGRRIGRVGLGMYAAPEYLEAAGTPTDLANLARHRFIGTCGPLSNYSPSIWFQNFAAQGQIVLSCSSLVGCLHAIESGLGIGLVTTFTAKKRGLIKVLDGMISPELPMWLLVHPDNKDLKRIRSTTAFLARRAKAEAEIFV